MSKSKVIITSKAKNNNPLTVKWTEHKRSACRIAKKLKRAGLDKRAKRMKDCGALLEYYHCQDCDTIRLARANLCRDRFCPICNWRLSVQRYIDMNRLMTCLTMAYPEFTYSLMTLTVKNCKPYELSETMTNMSKAWDRLLKLKSTKEHIAGWARATELTYNEKTKEIHPHYHVIIAWLPGLENDGAMISDWLKTTFKKGLVANVKAQHSASIDAIDGKDGGESLLKSILETFKYSVKSSEIENMPVGIFKKVAKQWSNKRLISFGGIIKEYRKKCRVQVEEAAIEEQEVCTRCHSQKLDRLIYEWCHIEGAYQAV